MKKISPKRRMRDSPGPAPNDRVSVGKGFTGWLVGFSRKKQLGWKRFLSGWLLFWDSEGFCTSFVEVLKFQK